MDDAHGGQDRGGKQRGGSEIRENPPADRRRDSRDVDPVDPGEVGPKSPAAPSFPLPPFDPVHDLEDRLLPVADQEGIEEGSDGRRVQRADPAAEDQGILLPPLGGGQRNPGQVEHGEQVRVGQFVAEGKPQEVELGGGTPRFQGGQRESPPPEMFLHVPPGREDPLAERPRAVVQDLMQEEDPEVGHPDLVHVGKPEEDADPRILPGDAGRPDLAPAVAGGFPDGGRQKAHALGGSNILLKSQTVHGTVTG